MNAFLAKASPEPQPLIKRLQEAGSGSPPPPTYPLTSSRNFPRFPPPVLSSNSSAYRLGGFGSPPSCGFRQWPQYLPPQRAQMLEPCLRPVPKLIGHATGPSPFPQPYLPSATRDIRRPFRVALDQQVPVRMLVRPSEMSRPCGRQELLLHELLKVPPLHPDGS